MVDDLFDFLTKFVAVAGTIDYGGKLIRWLIQQLPRLRKKHKSPRKRQLK